MFCMIKLTSILFVKEDVDSVDPESVVVHELWKKPRRRVVLYIGKSVSSVIVSSPMMCVSQVINVVETRVHAVRLSSVVNQDAKAIILRKKIGTFVVNNSAATAKRYTLDFIDVTSRSVIVSL